MKKYRSFFILVTVWIVWIALDLFLVFCARPFPSEDGPLHLYYVDAVRKLLAHQGDIYQYFKFKSIPPPYLFHYASLLLIENFVDAITAEQILVAIYVLWFSFAVYYLARSVGGNWIYACVFALPLTMSATLYLGFLNFTLSVPTLLLLIGFWIRHSGHWTLKSVLAFTALFLLMISMHPVPVIIFAGYLAIDAGVKWAFEVRESGGGIATAGKFLRSQRILLLPIAILAVWAAWVLLLLKVHPPGTWPTYQATPWTRLKDGVSMYALLPSQARGFRYPVIFFFMGALVFLARSFYYSPKLVTNRPEVLSLLVLGVSCCCAYCLVPEGAAGSGYFSIRFILVGTLLLLTLTAVSPSSASFRILLAIFAAVLAFSSTTQLLSVHKTVAENVRTLLARPVEIRGRAALVTPVTLMSCSYCNFNPYEYSGVHYLRRSGSVFLNGVWTSLPMIFLEPRDHHPWNDEMPEEIVKRIGSTADGSMPIPDFLIISQNGSQDAAVVPAKILELFEPDPRALGSDRFVLYLRKRVTVGSAHNLPSENLYSGSKEER